MTDDVLKKIEELRKVILEHERAYYVDAEPIIEDREFDRLMQELKSLEAQYPQYVLPQSPTQRVGGVATSFETAAHRIPMMSLDNAYSHSDLTDWINRMRKDAGDTIFPIVCELKIDGLSISLHYSEGKYISALTRGDGREGDLVTANVKTINALPLVIPGLHDMDVRGEIYIQKSRLVELNRKRIEEGLQPFKNCRNLAAGTLKNLDPEVSRERGLKLWVYDIAQAMELGFREHVKVLDFLHENGFPVCEHRKKCNSLEEIIQFLVQVQELRQKLDFDIDGAVLKVDSLAARNELRETSKAPKWAMAYKFAQEQVSTRLLSVEWQVGRSQLTPVAHLEPVELGGTTVSRASMHNLDQINEKDIREKDMVLIEKAGYIIPYIVCSLPEHRTGEEKKILAPEKCPSCGGDVLVSASDEDSSTVVKCPNSDCTGVLIRRVIHFLKSLEIENVGPSLVEKLVQEGLVKQETDVFSIVRDDLLRIERMGEKLADKVLANIAKARTAPFSKVIAALGIPNVGQVIAEDAAKKIRNPAALRSATAEELKSIHGIDKKIVVSIQEFVNDERVKRLLDDLDKYWTGQSETEESSAPVSSKISGKTFVITGEADVPRRELEALVKKHGGRVASSVSAKTDFLVIGSREAENFSSSKKTKALDLKIPIINEHDLINFTKE
ncbi:MAG: NAD-dependent DNA ligase LigA [Candidatus Riflebacteria bacterium]|nr:NAD-dependent DNA ligase LigA [Candidatus Riflebacteria bacterium]